MNSKTIKFVAGAGKTTESEKILSENKNGLYLAFTNSVVNDLCNKGYLSKTIDSLFVSFLMPKFTSAIPIIAAGAKINYVNEDMIPTYLKGVANIKIHSNGKIFNRSQDTFINMNTPNHTLYNSGYFKNYLFIQFIFSRGTLNLNDQHREEISNYILENYPNEIINFLMTRFDYIIIDEAQDLKGYREKFAELLYNSRMKLILFGDDNQNITGGGRWFEELIAIEYKNISFRCPEDNCKWIRENLDINIIGNNNHGSYEKIEYLDVLSYDNGLRTLLYNSKAGQNAAIINAWSGSKETIKKAKGGTIEDDIVIIGSSLNKKNLYTAITRTRKNVYSTIKKIVS